MRTTTVTLLGRAQPRTLTVAVHDADDKHISDSILERGEWEPFETVVVSRLVRAGDLVVDAGANIGWYTMVAASLGGRVVACEPLPANAALLRTNVEANELDGVVEVHECALGRVAGHASLALSADNQGDHRMMDRPTKRSTVVVQVSTLDALLAGRRPTLIKIDTQGSEVAILDGGRSGWAPSAADAAPVTLVLEFWPYGLAQCGASIEKLLALLGELLPETHRCFEIVEWRRSLRELSLDDLHRFTVEGGYTEAAKGFTNVLVVPCERVAEIDDLLDHSS
jgi:FkbM family methyltransferase